MKEADTFENPDSINLVSSQSEQLLLASTEKAPEQQLLLAKSKYLNVRLWLARNEFCAAPALRVLVLDVDAKVARTALAHRNLPADAIDAVSNKTTAELTATLDRLGSAPWSELGDIFSMQELPASILETLAARNDLRILFASASHPSAPESVWRKAFDHEMPWVKAAAALNPNVPGWVHEQLLEINDFDIAFALASNPNISEALQLTLAKHSDRSIRHHVGDQHLSPTLWQTIAEGSYPKDIREPLEYWLALALNPETPEKELIKFFWPSNKASSKLEILTTCVVHAVALHPHFPRERWSEYRYYLPWIDQKNRIFQMMILEGQRLPKPRQTEVWRTSTVKIGEFPAYYANYLAQHGNLDEKRVALYHPRLNRTLALPSVFSKDIPTLKKAAEFRGMPRFFYELLAAHAVDAVTQILEKNPDAIARGTQFDIKPIKTSARKTSSSKAIVKGDKKERIFMAENTSDLGALQVLVKDKVEDVRVKVARRPEVLLWPESWKALMTDSSVRVRAAFASNRALTWEILQALAEDKEPDVLESVIMQLNYLPRDKARILEEKFMKMDRLVKKHLADYSCEANILEALANDFSFYIGRKSNINGHLYLNLLAMKPKNKLIERLVSEQLRPEPIKERNDFYDGIVDIIFPLLCGDQETALNRYVRCKPLNKPQSIESFVALAHDFVSAIQASDAGMSIAIKDFVQLLEIHNGFDELDAWINKNIIGQYMELSSEEVFCAGVLSLLDGKVEGLVRAYLGHRPNYKSAVELAFGARGHQYENLTKHKDVNFRIRIAKKYPYLADLFAKDKSVEVRIIVAKTTMNVDLQKEFFGDKSLDVVGALALNEHCDIHLLEKLAQHPDAGVRYDVCNNKNTPEFLLHQLWKEAPVWVGDHARFKLSFRVADPKIQQEIIDQEWEYWPGALAVNPNISAQICLQLAQSGNERVRLELAENDACSDEALELLKNDPIRAVRIAAHKRGVAQ